MSFRAEFEGPGNRHYSDKGGHLLRSMMGKALNVLEREEGTPIHKGELWLQKRCMRRTPRDGRR